MILKQLTFTFSVITFCIFQNTYASDSLATDTLQIDTVVSHCTFCEYKNVEWANLVGHGVKLRKCPRSKRKEYYEEKLILDEYFFDQVIYWLKVYDIKDRLIYEGLTFSSCSIGPFISYYNNGSVKTKGYYMGVEYDEDEGYSFKTCSMEKTGVWTHYNRRGKVVSTEDYSKPIID